MSLRCILTTFSKLPVQTRSEHCEQASKNLKIILRNFFYFAKNNSFFVVATTLLAPSVYKHVILPLVNFTSFSKMKPKINHVIMEISYAPVR